MNFRRRHTFSTDDVRVDFIPLIDILLVVLIFITATTTFSQLHEIPVQLPSAEGPSLSPESHVLAISQDGQFALNGRFLSQGHDALSEALTALPNKTSVLIYADANARHAVVIEALEAARHAQFEKISFVTQQ